MSISLRTRYTARQTTSFGPFRFIEALPWIVLATAMRVVAYSGGPATLPAIIIASMAILLAFVLVAQRSIELADGQTGLGSLTLWEQIKLARAILGRIVLLMIAAASVVAMSGYTSLAPNLMLGLDGMAFDQFTMIGKFWSATVASFVLLMIVRADANHGAVDFFATLNELARRSFWIGAAILALGAIYLTLGYVQGLVRHAVWIYGQTSPHGTFVRNLVFFVFIFSFAMLRLWITLIVLTYGLKYSYRSA
jgi:hypothetical protein